jgi:hypothetical protein
MSCSLSKTPDFIRNVYRALLKRDPRRGGPRAPLDVLYGGSFSKVDVLCALWRSAEAAHYGVKVRGLRSAAALSRIRRLPVVGAVVSVVFACCGCPPRAQSRTPRSAAVPRERELRAATQAAFDATQPAAPPAAGEGFGRLQSYAQRNAWPRCAPRRPRLAASMEERAPARDVVRVSEAVIGS